MRSWYTDPPQDVKLDRLERRFAANVMLDAVDLEELDIQAFILTALHEACEQHEKDLSFAMRWDPRNARYDTGVLRLNGNPILTLSLNELSEGFPERWLRKKHVAQEGERLE